MREILFRGKRKDNGEWVKGAFCPKSCDGLLDPMVDRPSIIKLDKPNDGFWFDVEPDTVGQHIGFPDKNDKPIFEGDICRICRGYEVCIAVVEYKENIASFIWRCNEKEMLLPLDMRRAQNKVGDAVWVEVIGNIHDSPELMAPQKTDGGAGT